MAQRRLMKPDDDRRFSIELHLHAALSSLGRLNGDDRRLRRCRRYLTERLLDQDHNVRWMNIAHNGDGRIPGTVMGLEEGFGVGRCEREDVRLPTDRRNAIRMFA